MLNFSQDKDFKSWVSIMNNSQRSYPAEDIHFSVYGLEKGEWTGLESGEGEALSQRVKVES